MVAKTYLPTPTYLPIHVTVATVVPVVTVVTVVTVVKVVKEVKEVTLVKRKRKNCERKKM